MIYICMFGVPVLLSWSLYKFRIKEMSLADNIVVVFSLFFLQNFCTCFISSCRGCIGFSFHEMTNTYIAKYVALSSVIGIVIVLLLKRLHSSYIHTYKCISATSRNGTIDFMKFVFSIIIVLFHSAKFFEEHNRIFINGRIGVEFFFLVSGYLMAKNSQYYMKEKSIGKATKDFLLKKIKGMCPEVYVAFIFAFLVVHMISDISLCKLIKDLINSIFSLLFLGMGGLHGYDPNGNTWYISAMLLSMLILFPLLIRNEDIYVYIVAPSVFIFGLGYIYVEKGSVAVNTQWTGVICMGILRGMAEIALGSICYFISEKIRKYCFTKRMKCIFTLAEVMLYLYVIIDIYRNDTSENDFSLIMLLAIAIVISFSEQSLLIKVFNKPIFTWLGRISFPIFLGHGFWLTGVSVLFLDFSNHYLFIAYLFLSFLTAITITVICELIRDNSEYIFGWLQKECIIKNN